MELLDGDLLFLDLRERELSEAIADVTQRQFQVSGLPLSHVGVVIQEDGEWKVYESWDQVQLSPLSNYLAKAMASYHARLLPEWQPLIPKALQELKQLVGRSYDYDFKTNSENYYCSHLVAEAFRHANAGKPLFEYSPMYFGDPNDPNDASWKTWELHFKRRNQKVPTGEPGISPLGIYLSNVLERMK